jgi:hypothetical protein
MAHRLAPWLFRWMCRPGSGVVLLAELLFGCSRPSHSDAGPEKPPRKATSRLTEPPAPPAASSAAAQVVAVQKQVQATKLRLPARRLYRPQLAFGKGILGQLTGDGLRVLDATTFEELAHVPVDGPRAVLAAADGALLAVGADSVVRWERHEKRAMQLSRPILMPTAQVFADAREPDRLWVFEDAARGAAGAELHAYRLTSGAGALALPEQTIELGPRSEGVLGITREGVWVYLSRGHAARLAPGGAKLPGLTLDEGPLPSWALAWRRLDQSLWVDERGTITRTLLSPSFKRLDTTSVDGQIFDAATGDEGRLLALLTIVGEGPAFALELRDQDLVRRAVVPLPAEAPTGGDDWVKVVTANQNLSVSPYEGKVAVGGPSRLSVIDARGQRIFSIPSM